jgi:hypothetical protein
VRFDTPEGADLAERDLEEAGIRDVSPFSI